MRTSFAASIWLGIVVLTATLPRHVTGAQDRDQKKGATPPYARVNLSTWYQVDSKWPQKPAGFVWKDMPGVAVDREDRVWIFTRSVPPVQVYDTAGKFIRSWGDDSVATAHHMKIDHDGNVWLADIGHHVVRKYSQEGKVLLTLGTPDSPGESNTQLDKPTDMAVTVQGDVFVSDGYGNNRVVHFDRHGKFVKAWGKLGTAPGEFSCPHAIALDSRGRLYVADRNNVRVQVFDQSGKLLDVWTNLVTPWGFWVTPSDDIWVCGSSPMPWYDFEMLGCPPRDQVFMRFHTSGKLQQLWTVPKGNDGSEQPGDCNWVHCMALDSKGNIYAGDIMGRRVQKFIRQ